MLLRELPFALPAQGPIVLPIPPPPSHRQERQRIAGPGFWLWSGGALAALALMLLIGRWLLGRRRGGADRWLPGPEEAQHRGGPELWALTAAIGGLLAYGVFALDEAMDLLEYTYFQEAFAGTNPLAVAFSPVVAERAHAPGYAVLLWALTAASNAEWWLRLPALLSAVAGVWMLFRLTADGTGSRPAGLLAAALGGLTPLAMRYGRDVTPYSLVGLLAVVSTWLLYRALTGDRRRDWIAWTAVSVLAFFLHYFTAFLVIGQAACVLWLWLRGGRGPWWTRRLSRALMWFGALGVLPLLWSAQVVRAFVISAQDNLVTHAVYPIAPDFVTYTVNHLRVLVGLPAEVAWLVWPLLALVVVGYVVLLRERPIFGRLLLVPFLLVIGLLATTYLLHSFAYGGRIYYGWRWLRPYTAAIAVPVAYLLVRPMPRWGRAAAWALGGAMLLSTAYTGGRSALRRERPAQRAGAHALLDAARDGDAIAVLPAAFYTVGWAYYLHRGEPRFVHAGPSSWEYYPRGDDFVRIYGPIRSFGIPLESLAGHVDVRRLWVCVFREVIFDQPEFDEALPEHVLGALDQRTERLKRWRLPHLDLHLYASEAPNPWAGGRRVQVDTQRLYRSLRWLPAALDPESLREVVRNARPIRLRLPSPTPIGPVPIRIAGAPADAPPASVRLEGGSLQFDSGAWTGTIVVERSDLFDVTIHRTGAALAWPLTIEVGR